jgi:pyridoxine kinase
MIVCDPVLGDHPGGLYVPESVAHAVRERLLPRATHVKPNPFELSFLSGRDIATLEEVVEAARALSPAVVLASSVQDGPDRLANVIVTESRAGICSVRRESDVPHGTGDLLTALFLSHALAGEDPLASAALAAAGVAAAIAASRGHDELQLASPIDWHRAAPLAPLSIAPIPAD